MISLCLNMESSFASFSHIIEDAKRLNMMFRSCSWLFVRRSDNEVAHYLAKFAKSILDCLSWKEEALEFLLPLLHSDSFSSV